MKEKRNRQELIAKRNLLYWQFLNDPEKTNLSVGIKALDDQNCGYHSANDRERKERRQIEVLILTKAPVPAYLSDGSRMDFLCTAGIKTLLCCWTPDRSISRLRVAEGNVCAQNSTL